jgi:Tfp pilus assembly protein PilF
VHDPQEYGRDHNVDHVISTAVSILGNRIRVNASVVRVADGATLWGENFDGEIEVEGVLQDPWAIQDNMAVRIVAALQPHLAPASRVAAARGVRTTSVEALGLYQQARRQFWAFTNESNNTAIRLLVEATERDPNYADAWAALSEALGYVSSWRAVRPEERALAARAFEKAIELDSLNGYILTQRGWRRIEAADWDGAWDDMRRATQLAPSSFDVTMNYAGFLRFVGRPDSSLVYFQRAREVDPANAVTWQSLGHVYSLLGKQDSALLAARHALSLDSALWYAHMNVADLEYRSGRRAVADSAVAKAVRFGGGEAHALAAAARYHALAGDRVRAKRLADQVEAMASTRRVDPVALADARIAVGDVDGAFKAMDAAEPFDGAVFLIRHQSRFGSDPRYVAMRRRVYGDREVPRYATF